MFLFLDEERAVRLYKQVLFYYRPFGQEKRR